MHVSLSVLLVFWLAGPGGNAAGATAQSAAGSSGPAAGTSAAGYLLERDADVAVEEPGTHSGGGRTVGYAFFRNAPDLKMVFRKRALKPGSAIGYHEQHADEIYYVLSGRGVMTIDGTSFEVGPGTAILTRPGSSHGLRQTGPDDLVLIINYQQPGPERALPRER